LKTKQMTFTKDRYLCLLTLIFYLLYLLILTLSPFEFSATWLRRLLAYDTERFLRYIFHVDILDVLGNLVLFMPLGMLLFFLLPKGELDIGKKRFWLLLAVSAILSGSIETAQLFLRRSASVVDIVFNSAGALSGYYGVPAFQSFIRLYRTRLSEKGRRIIHALAMHAYAAAFIVALFIPPGRNHLRSWDATYPLILGNEGTEDRPWDGDVYLVAVYPKTLSVDEMRHLYRRGLNKASIDARRRMGAVALYPFTEGESDTVHDVSGRGNPLHLVGRDVDWIEGLGGIAIHQGKRVKSYESGEKIVRAVRETHQFTVEVWMRTDELHQWGPARIVSLSCNPDWRNFTLGQEGNGIVFRVRTPLTGPNGSLIHLTAKSVLRDSQLHHVVATFHRGVERLLVDGRPHRAAVRGDIDYLPHVLLLGHNRGVQVGFCFLALFPWCMLLYFYFQRRRFLWTVVVAGVLVVLVQTAYHRWLGQPFGWLFFSSAVITAVLSGLLGRAWDRNGVSARKSG